MGRFTHAMNTMAGKLEDFFIVGGQEEPPEPVASGDEEDERERDPAPARKSGPRVVPEGLADTYPHMVAVAPKSMDDAAAICDRMRKGQVCVLDFSTVDVETARRIYDFVIGAAYQHDYYAEDFSRGVFIFAPENTVIDRRLTDSRTSVSYNRRRENR